MNTSTTDGLPTIPSVSVSSALTRLSTAATAEAARLRTSTFTAGGMTSCGPMGAGAGRPDASVSAEGLGAKYLDEI